MSDTTCTQCGEPLPEASGRRYCSDRCRGRASYARKPRVPCGICGEPTGYVLGTIASAEHNACIRARSKASHGTLTGYRAGCRCDGCREAKSAAQRAYAADVKRREGKSLYRKYRKRNDERHWISRADRYAIYERDAWTCQLCMESVKDGLPSNDPMSATLDHIVCQSWTLIPNHDPSNLRLAHRSCNSRRRDGRTDVTDPPTATGGGPRRAGVRDRDVRIEPRPAFAGA